MKKIYFTPGITHAMTLMPNDDGNFVVFDLERNRFFTAFTEAGDKQQDYFDADEDEDLSRSNTVVDFDPAITLYAIDSDSHNVLHAYDREGTLWTRSAPDDVPATYSANTPRPDTFAATHVIFAKDESELCLPSRAEDTIYVSRAFLKATDNNKTITENTHVEYAWWNIHSFRQDHSPENGKLTWDGDADGYWTFTENDGSASLVHEDDLRKAGLIQDGPASDPLADAPKTETPLTQDPELARLTGVASLTDAEGNRLATIGYDPEIHGKRACLTNALVTVAELERLASSYFHDLRAIDEAQINMDTVSSSDLRTMPYYASRLHMIAAHVPSERMHELREQVYEDFRILTDEEKEELQNRFMQDAHGPDAN